jgi:tetratricopeptide (TPR) repeat protein
MIRATAVSLLGNFNDSLSRKAIERALGDPESLVRHSAINSYRAVDAESFEKIMTPLVNDPVRGVRAQAAIRISEIPEEMLSEPMKKARKAALEEYKNTNLYVADFPGGRYNLGIMYTNEGNLEEAANAYREALRIDGLFYMARVNLAMVYASQGRNMEAENLLREVIEDNPEMDEIYYSLALLLAENGKIEESRRYFREAASRMPDRPRIIYNLALLENSSGNLEIAENYLLKALGMEPGNRDFLYAISAFYLENNKLPQALVYAKRMLELYPDDPTAQQMVQYASR